MISKMKCGPEYLVIEDIFKSQVLPYLLKQKIILAFANERAIQRTADSLEYLGVPKIQMFGLIGQSLQVERSGLDIPHTFVSLPECTLAFELRAYHNALRQLGEAQKADIDAFDPDCQAIVIGAFWFELPSVADRRVFGQRHPSWIRYEDKCAVSFIWDKAKIVQAKSEIIPAFCLREGLPKGWEYPFVLSGDSLNGITGGGSHVRAIHSAEQLEVHRPFFESDCAQLRMMDYIDGISCSIHGMVIDNVVLSSIPIEMVVVPRADGKFMYMGASTHWEPNSSEKAHLEDVVRKVGHALREEADFRGTFTVDGVLMNGQFYPTEINTRAGAGIFALYSQDHTSYYLLDLMLKDGQFVDLDTSALQDWMRVTAHSNRSARAWGEAEIDGECPNETHSLIFEAGQWLRIDDEREGAATLSISEGRTGAFMMLAVASETLKRGELFMPYVQVAMQYCDAQWKTSFLRRQ